MAASRDSQPLLCLRYQRLSGRDGFEHSFELVRLTGNGEPAAGQVDALRGGLRARSRPLEALRQKLETARRYCLR